MTYDIAQLTESDIEQMSPEEQQELSKQLDSGEESSAFSSPTPEKKDSTLVLFREIIDKTDTTKLGFLRKEELGLLPHSVRKLKKIALFAESQNLMDLAEYFTSQAEIILATSLSYKSKLLDTIVTQIRKDMKIQSSPQVKKSGGWFSSKTTSEGEPL